MSWTDRDGVERGGACNECGEQVEEEHHAYCADCYAEQQQRWFIDEEYDDDAGEERDR